MYKSSLPRGMSVAFVLGCTQPPQLDLYLLESTLIPSGQYSMGPPEGFPSTPTLRHRTVQLTYDFEIMTTEISIGQWRSVDNTLPNQFCTERAPTPIDIDHPVRCISWCQAVIHANQQSLRSSLVPAYRMDDVLLESIIGIECNERAQFIELDPKANGWRLPTEAEWEIAANQGHKPNQQLNQSWYVENSDKLVHPVATKMPNSIGLYDVQGNVFEWIWERYGGFQFDTVTDPFTVENKLEYNYSRPIKGGGILSTLDELSIYNRAYASPSMQHEAIGFRLVRTIQ